ncbi:MAG: hypothetical protein IJX17_08290 [Clostridia bacterium]|nr:hypothetical protein [Clostridia bacterium]
MEGFNAKDIIIQKAMSQNIIDELKVVYQKNNDATVKLAESYNALYNQMINAKTLADSEKISNQIDELKLKFVQIFAINKKIEVLIKRNETRLKFFEWRINTEKIIKFDVNKKQLIAKLETEKVSVEDDLLNINIDKDSKVPVFCNEQILILKNGKLSLEDNVNYQILRDAEDKDFKMITEKFPTVLMTITDTQLTNIRFKERILKQLITIIDDKLKKLPVEQINDYFGNPLNFNTKVVLDYNEYIEEIKNLLQVRVKQYLEKTYPYLSKEVNQRLVCNEQSLFLPPKYFVKLEEEISNDSYEDEIYNYEEESYDEEDNEYETETQDDIDDFNDFLMGLLGEESEDESNEE